MCLGTTLPALAHKPAAHNRAKASATTMADQAGKAYESGDFQRAALLYYNAWQTDDETPDYLFAAARAAHVGGLLDMAVEHYEEYLKTPDIDAGRDKKARAYLLDIREAKAAVKGQEAEKAQRTGDNALAAQLYQQAWQIAPHRHEYRFKSAVVLQSSGQLPQAEALLLAYLADAPADAVDRPEAQARLASIQKGRAPAVALPIARVEPPKPAPVVAPAPPPPISVPVAKPTPVVAPPPVVVPAPVVPPPVATPAPVAKPIVVQPAPTPPVAQPKSAIQQPATVTAPAVKGPSRVLGWVLTISGAVLLAASGSAAYTQYQDTQTYKNPGRDASGLITSMTATEGKTLADRIDQNRAVAGVCAVLGVTSLSIGIWQLVRSPSTDHVSVVPTLGGAALAGRF